MYRIRFHGRGGQGMKTASHILGNAFFREGFEVQDAPRYGAERRGAPIFAYVRAAREPIRQRGNIVHPDLVAVADETLVPVPAAGVLEGVDAHCVMLIDTLASADQWRRRLNLKGPVVTLPARGAVEDRAEQPFIGAMCAGAAARLVGVIRRETLEAALREELAALGEEIVAQNVEHALWAFDATQAHAGLVKERGEAPPAEVPAPRWIAVPFDEARVSAPDIHAGATSVEVRTGLWRTMRPIIDYDHCRRCSWVCSTFCPDSAIHVLEDGRPEIDYDHCKGCLICAAVCPPHAIRAIPEREAQREGPIPSSLPRKGGGGEGAHPKDRGYE
jgi:pyruvate ferredoxin oxidoreductase gamma subunit